MKKLSNNKKQYIPDISEVLSKLDAKTDHLAIVIYIHLHTEFLINMLMERQCVGIGEAIVNNRRYSYAMKLEPLEAINLISGDLLKNLKTLNKIRNSYAHDLNYDFWHDAKDFSGQFGLIISKNAEKYRKATLLLIAGCTFTPLYHLATMENKLWKTWKRPKPR